ncbi:MAG: IclR family transcriptional regulator [Rhizobiales bacterium]|nr:IclR family transcriptional regulator [Hyphomicrobiales bacterium]
MSQSATVRTLDILDLLSSHPDGLGLTGVCDALAIPKSVAHRLLAMLVERGWARQDPVSDRYGLTLKFDLVGLRHYAGTGLTDISQPILDRLAESSGELARLAIVDGDGMHWVAKAQGAPYGLRYDPDTGYDVVLHATAVGKVWLATLPEERAIRIVEATRYETPKRFGRNVIRTTPAFRKALADTRARGFGEAVEEGEPGTSAVAVVVRASSDAEAPAVGTLSIAGPATRLTTERRAALAQELLAAARELSLLWPIRAPSTPQHRPAASAERSAAHV